MSYLSRAVIQPSKESSGAWAKRFRRVSPGWFMPWADRSKMPPADSRSPTIPLPFFRSTLRIGFGSRIGVCEIRGIPGEGSCDKAFRAERVKLDSQLDTIKIVHGLLDHKPCSRFTLVTQCLALRDQSNIDRLHDCGTSFTGLPRIVSEFVEGEYLTFNCDGNALALNLLFELVVTAARAMAQVLAMCGVFGLRDGNAIHEMQFRAFGFRLLERLLARAATAIVEITASI